MTFNPLPDLIRVAGRTENGDLILHVPREVEEFFLALIEVDDEHPYPREEAA